MRKSIKIFLSCLFIAIPATAFSQEPMSEEEEQDKLYEYIDNRVSDLEKNLDLDGDQVFFADSILTHDLFAMSAELKELSSKKMSIPDAYVAIQDKWNEASYYAFKRILTEEQWARYLKSGAEKEQKAREKRAAKRASK